MANTESAGDPITCVLVARHPLDGKRRFMNAPRELHISGRATRRSLEFE